MEYSTVKGKIRIITGLRIGADQSSIEIGGSDNPIVRHPITLEPYLPGSSLKGKLRSLLERDHFQIGTYDEASRPYNGARGDVKNDRDPCSCGKCAVCWLFGCGDIRRSQGPTRLLFRDCPLSEDEAKKLAELSESAQFYTETKSEVQVPRKTGDANPRPIDRIPAGLHLDMEISVRVVDGDNVEWMKSTLQHAFEMLEHDSLGGSGSRGYGKVRFVQVTWDGDYFYGEQ